MTEKILKALDALKITVWKLNDIQRESAELFFVRKKEDIRRAVQVREINVSVYRDFESDGKAMRGMSSALIQPGMSEDEIENKLKIAYEAAKYVKNPFFELPDPSKGEKKDEGELAALSAEEAAEIMAEALFAPDRMDDAFINSAEIFSTRTFVRTLTSRGTDVSYRISRVKGEFVAQCISPTDVELYYDFEYAAPDTLSLSGLAADALSTVRDRSEAASAPKAGVYNLILTRKHVYTVLSAYAEKADAALVFPKYSPYCEGFRVQDENATGDLLNISVFPAAPYSNEGIPMPERTLMENGVVKGIFGNARFCRYLGIEPTGSYSNIRVQCGKTPFEEMKKRPYLMPVAFSDFQMDAMSGRFGGEIRLAYLYDGETLQIVTGGSVSGSLLEKQNLLTLSQEKYTDSVYDGPYAIAIPEVNVAGA